MVKRAQSRTFILSITVIGILALSNISPWGFEVIFTSSAEEPRPLGPTVYHSFLEMETELNQIAADHPGITKLESIGKSLEGWDIWAMKVSDNPDIEEDEQEIYYNGMHHAREWPTMEVCLYILNYLTDNYGSNSTITNIVDNRQIWVVPCVNPDGRVYDSAGDDPADHNPNDFGKGWRKNKRDNGGSIGVDLNRNYGYMWGGVGGWDNPSSETYRGPEPFSEPETQVIRDFVSQHDFIFSISYHGYGQLILYPWGYTYNDPADEDLFVAVGENMAGLITNKAGSAYPGYTPQQGSDLYLTSGSDEDWLYGQMGIYPFIIELYPFWNESDPAVSSPYDKFHPRADKVVPICEDNIEAALYLAQIADNPNQVFDYHVSLSTNLSSQLINQTETETFPITITNDGATDDWYDIVTSTISGWTISIIPSIVILSSETSTELTLSVTVPAGTLGGEYQIWIDASSLTNSSISASLVVSVRVPYFNDVGILSQDTFMNNGLYPMQDYSILSTTKNYGRNTQSAYNVSLEIKKLGPPVSRTIFSDDMESGLNGWQVEDLDGSGSSGSWKQVTSSSYSPTTSWWCGSTTQYTNLCIQNLISPPFSLKWADSAYLLFYHKYKTEDDYDYCIVDAWDGESWIFLQKYEGNGPSSFEQVSISLDDFIGLDDVRIRFRFASDRFVVDDGWYIDDVEISAVFPSETTVYGPINIQTTVVMAQDAIQQLKWDYTFTQTGEYKIYVTTLLGTDEFQDNNQSAVRIRINPPNWNNIFLEYGWNLISLPLIQEDVAIGAVLKGIEGDYDAIQLYNKSDLVDPWKHHQISKPYDFNDLYWIDHSIGFWIHITEPSGTNLNTTGWQLSSPQYIPLYPGWNLVGYPSQTSYNRTDGLNNLTFGTHVDAIQWYDSNSKTWHFMGPSDSFVLGRGYWIHSKIDTPWEVPI
jgi:hypothetical protein